MTIIHEIETTQDLLKIIDNREIHNYAFQSLDLRKFEDTLKTKNVTGCMFLGCELSPGFLSYLVKNGNFIFPKLEVPFNPYLAQLYTRATIYENFDYREPESYALTPDSIIYKYYMKTGAHQPESIHETLAQRLHDHSITDALTGCLEKYDKKLIIAVMGGHSLFLIDDDYRKVAFMTKRLSEQGFVLLSGGGPGAMEATHLGAYFHGRSPEDLENALELLSEAPSYSDKYWLSKAFEVIEKYPKHSGVENDIGIPTWMYGHEPPTPFASKIAKYFANSVRGEGLLALAKGGIIYSPGSAGTIQEIFQDAAQNHYRSYGVVSPMIFYNSRYWTEEKPVFPLLQQLAKDREYHKYLYLADDEEEVVRCLREFNGM